jgi:hypothetical protein
MMTAMTVMAAARPDSEKTDVEQGSTPAKSPVDEILEGALSRTTAEKAFIALVAASSSIVSYYATEAFGVYGGKGADLVPTIGDSQAFNEALAEPSAWSTNFVLSQYMFTVITVGIIDFIKHRRFAQKHDIPQQSLWKLGTIFSLKLFYSVLPSFTLALLAPLYSTSFCLMIATYTFQQAYGLNTFNRLHDLYKNHLAKPEKPNTQDRDNDLESQPLIRKSDTFAKLEKAAEDPSWVKVNNTGGIKNKLNLVKTSKINEATPRSTQAARTILHPTAMICQAISVVGYFNLTGKATMELSKLTNTWFNWGTLTAGSNIFWLAKIAVFLPFAALNAELTIDVIEQMIKLPEKARETFSIFKQGRAIPCLVEAIRFFSLLAAVLLSFESGASSLALNEEADLGDWSIWPTEVGVTMFNVFSLMEVINYAADTAHEYNDYSPEQREEQSRAREAARFYKAQSPEIRDNLPELAGNSVINAP